MKCNENAIYATPTDLHPKSIPPLSSNHIHMNLTFVRRSPIRVNVRIDVSTHISRARLSHIKIMITFLFDKRHISSTYPVLPLGIWGLILGRNEYLWLVGHIFIVFYVGRFIPVVRVGIWWEVAHIGCGRVKKVGVLYAMLCIDPALPLW